MWLGHVLSRGIATTHCLRGLVQQRVTLSSSLREAGGERLVWDPRKGTVDGLLENFQGTSGQVPHFLRHRVEKARTAKSEGGKPDGLDVCWGRS